MNQDLDLNAYNFELDESYIAARPTEHRPDAKLLVFNATTGEITHSFFSKLDSFLPVDSLIVFNNSKVFKARLLGNKSSGAKVEVFVLSLLPDEQGCYHCLVKSSRKKRVGDCLIFKAVSATIEQCNEDGTFYLSFSLESDELAKFLEEQGKIPIPPYIRAGESDRQDEEDYQTVFAKSSGSVACPTAGLHFDNNLLAQLAQKKIQPGYVTLHVGLGTFLPVKVDNILEHKMHSESYYIEPAELEKISSAKFVTAVGTTSLRVLESSYGQEVEANKFYATDIFSTQVLRSNLLMP